MSDGEWREDLSRALGTDLADLLGSGPDDAALGAGVLAWLARAKQRGLLKPGGLCAMAVRLTDGAPAELDIPAIVHDGDAKGPWVIMLCPAGHTGGMAAWDAAVAPRPGGPTRSKWLRGGDLADPTPHALLADRSDLLRLGHASLGAALRPSMAAVAGRQGVASSLIFGVMLADTLATALGQGAACLSTRSTGVTVGDRRMGDWTLRCATHDHLGLRHRDVELGADTSTPEGAAEVRRMLSGDTVVTSITMTYQGDDLTEVATRGRAR